MKIALVGPISLELISELVEGGENLPDGYQYPLAAYLVRSLLAAGQQVAVVTSVVEVNQPQSWYGKNIEIHVTPRRRHYVFCFDFYWKERAVLVRAIANSRPDVVHAQWTYEFAHAAKASGFPYLVTARDSPRQILRHMKSPYRLFRYIYASWLIPKINWITAISPYMANELTAAFRLKREPLIVPNGLDYNLYVEEKALTRKDTIRKLVTVSGWDPRKNVKNLLRAFSVVRSLKPDLELTLIGHSLGEGGPAMSWAKEHGLKEGVVFRGALSHAEALAAIRNDADIFIHTTLEESFGMSILEAMAQGKAVVAHQDAGAVPWLLQEGAGVLTDCLDPSAIASTILGLVNDPDQVYEVEGKALQRARDHFRMSVVAEKYIQVYGEVLADAKS
jgi:glycosyltransferase involved in cell wall biosynthesis